MDKDKVIVLINGEKCDKTRDMILKKSVEKQADELYDTYVKLVKSANKVSNTSPEKYRDATLKLHRFIHSLSKSQIDNIGIEEKTIKFIDSWKKVLKESK